MLNNISWFSSYFPGFSFDLSTSSTGTTSDGTTSSSSTTTWSPESCQTSSGWSTDCSGSSFFDAMSQLSCLNPSYLNQQATDILKRPPFEPTDVNLFTPQTYSAATATVPAAEKPVDEGQIKMQLSQTLLKRFPFNWQEVQNGMALYNDPAIQSKVSDPRLRAALVALKGTPGEAAIDSIKSGKFESVSFKDLPAGVIAAVEPAATPDAKPKMYVNSRYQHEDFRLISPTLVHEALHDDTVNSGREERINHSLETMVYGKMILENPSLASSGTELSRRENTKFMARLNSRDTDGKLRLFTSQGNVYPGGTALSSFGAAFTSVGGDTPGGSVADSSPGNATLQAVLKGVTGVNATSPNFDADTESIIDQNQVMFQPTQLVQLAKILKLNLG